MWRITRNRIRFSKPNLFLINYFIIFFSIQYTKHEAKILAKRRRSIQRKYDQYARDENFRQQYKQRVISGAFLAEQFNDIDQVRGGSPMPTGVLSPPPFERDPYTSTPIVKALTRSVTNIEENVCQEMLKLVE